MDHQATSVPFRRRRIVVDRRLQWTLCLHVVAYGAFVLFGVTCGLFVPLLLQLDGGGGDALALADQAAVMLYMHERFWLVAAVCFGFVAFGAMRFSHRIAGPLVRYKRNLRLLARGELPPPLRTRSRDFLKEEVVCLNEAVAGVREQLAVVTAAQAVLRRELHALADRAGPLGAADLAAALAASRQVDRALAGFREVDPGDELQPMAMPEPAVAMAGSSGADA